MKRAVSFPTLVLLPGMDGTGQLFAPFRSVLSADIPVRVIAYPKSEPLGYEELLDRIRSELPSVPFLLVGESFSGPLAIRIAAGQPPGLQGLVLVASFAVCPVSLRFVLPLAYLLFSLPMPRWVVRRFFFGQNASDREVTLFRENLRRVSPKVLARRLHELMTVDVRRDLKDIKVPILYMLAGQDRLLSRKALTDLQKICPDLEVALVPDAPHLILQKFPLAALQALLKWRDLRK